MVQTKEWIEKKGWLMWPYHGHRIKRTPVGNLELKEMVQQTEEIPF